MLALSSNVKMYDQITDDSVHKRLSSVLLDLKMGCLLGYLERGLCI